MSANIDLLLKVIDEQVQSSLKSQSAAVARAVVEELGSGAVTSEQLARVITEVSPLLVSASIRMTVQILDDLGVIPDIDPNQARRHLLHVVGRSPESL